MSSELFRSEADLQQGSDAWHQARLGKCTGSKFGSVMTKGRRKGEFSNQAMTYMLAVISERVGNCPTEEVKSKYVEWGKTHEPTARQLYQFEHGGDLSPVGFVNHPTIPNVGASPDGLVGNDGVLEIKCPYTISKHIATIEANAITDKNYQWQVQGQMWVTERQWCDFVSFHPYVPEKLQLHVVRVERDEDMIEDLEAAVTRFMEQVEVRVSNIRAAKGISDETGDEVDF